MFSFMLFSLLSYAPNYPVAYIAQPQPIQKVTSSYNFEVSKCLKTLSLNILTPLIERFKAPVHVTSDYRSVAHNKAIRGAINSKHTYGEAVDISSRKGDAITKKEIFDYIKDNLEFDQLIWERDHVHVSFTSKYPNRNQVLIL